MLKSVGTRSANGVMPLLAKASQKIRVKIVTTKCFESDLIKEQFDLSLSMYKVTHCPSISNSGSTVACIIAIISRPNIRACGGSIRIHSPDTEIPRHASIVPARRNSSRPKSTASAIRVLVSAPVYNFFCGVLLLLWVIRGRFSRMIPPPLYKPTDGYFLPDRAATIVIGVNGKIKNAETRLGKRWHQKNRKLATFPYNSGDKGLSSSGFADSSGSIWQKITVRRSIKVTGGDILPDRPATMAKKGDFGIWRMPPGYLPGKRQVAGAAWASRRHWRMGDRRPGTASDGS